MLSLNLTPIFKARGIEKPFTFLVNAGLPKHSATRLINNKPAVLRLDHVELLCRVLLCEPNDLLLFKPEKGQQYAANHPLLKLTQTIPVNNWQQTLAEMPLNQLRQVTKSISDIKPDNLPIGNQLTN